MAFQLKPMAQRELGIFILLLFLTSTNFLLFGLNHYATPGGDSEQYNLYAKNIALGNGYTTDPINTKFSMYREPGYPIFLSSIYLLFGIENFAAVKIVQVILLTVTAFLIFRIFGLFNYGRLGILSGSIFTFLPLYAYQANLLQSELLTVFLLVSSFLVVLTILRNNENFKNYVLLGVIFSLLALTRAHMLLMPFILAVIFYFRGKPIKNNAIFLMIVVISVLSWMTYVYSNTDIFTITKGRDDLHLYTRSIRATLSYRQQVSYFNSWLRDRAQGGQYEDKLLKEYGPWFLTQQYGILLNHGQSEAKLKKESIGRIKNNLGQYLFGNMIEISKMLFIEHLYPPVSPLLTRSVRAIIYLAIYALFIAGIISFLFSKNNKFSILIGVGSIYIFYNLIVLSFFDVIPRFNTPYLGLYLIVGIAGLTNLNYKLWKIKKVESLV